MSAVDHSGVNTSGDKSITSYPPGLDRWNWPAFLWGGIWAIGHRSWIGLLTFLPYIGLVFAIWQGAQGYKWAWKNNRYESVEDLFLREKKWLKAWFIFFGGIMLLGILSALIIPLVFRGHAG
ncbi:MAG TPA: hypothetical protein VJ385_15565 [Fibrobacteria bacterium]|nr:hypothetical protein [Fibrobacteria bacterium]